LLFRYVIEQHELALFVVVDELFDIDPNVHRRSFWAHLVSVIGTYVAVDLISFYAVRRLVLVDDLPERLEFLPVVIIVVKLVSEELLI
jgi:hypothetical protein